MLAVDRDEPGPRGCGGIEDEGAADDEGLLVRQRHIGAGRKGREGRTEPGGTGHRVEDDVGGMGGDRLGGGVPQMNLTNGNIDSAACGEFGQPFPHSCFAAGRGRGQPDDGDGEVERLPQQKVDLGPAARPTTAKSVAFSARTSRA